MVDTLYQLSQVTFKTMTLPLMAEDIIKLLTNDQADSKVKQHLMQMIDKKNQDRKKKASKAKLLAKKNLLNKKNQANKFLSMMDQVQTELGPKCAVCEDGYTAKPNEILGMYIYSKPMTCLEVIMTESKSPTQFRGYTSVTHSSYVHFKCH
jgi:hypothetical protein